MGVKKKTPPPVFVNCKSCGSVMDVSEDPENWQLQCDGCKENKVELPGGYEKVAAKHKAEL